MNGEIDEQEIMITSKLLVFVLSILISMNDNSIVLKGVRRPVTIILHDRGLCLVVLWDSIYLGKLSVSKRTSLGSWILN